MIISFAKEKHNSAWPEVKKQSLPNPTLNLVFYLISEKLWSSLSGKLTIKPSWRASIINSLLSVTLQHFGFKSRLDRLTPKPLFDLLVHFGPCPTA